MVDVFIDTLSLRIVGGPRHQHRVEPIVRQAASLLTARLRDLASSTEPARSVRVGVLTAPRQQLDLAATTDAEAAEQIASAWLDAIAPVVPADSGAPAPNARSRWPR
jgi:hypothetical protein